MPAKAWACIGYMATEDSASTELLFTALNMLKIKINKFPPACASDGLHKMSIMKFTPTGFYLFLVIPGLDKACKGMGMHWLYCHGGFCVERTVIYGLEHVENKNKYISAS